MFQNKKVNVVISIVAALIIWAYVVVEINPTRDDTIHDIPVEITNVDTLNERGLTIVDGEKHMIDVTIEGPRSEISQVNVEDIEATADVFGFPKGNNDVKVKVTVPEGVRKEDVKPETINLKIEEYVTVSRPVKVNFDGSFPSNTEPGFISMAPEELEVSGAKSIVENISHVEAPLDVNDLEDEEKTFSVEPVAINKKGEPVYDMQLSQDTVDVKCALSQVKRVPLDVDVRGKVDERYKVTNREIPRTVTIRGLKSQVDQIDKLEADPISVRNITKTTEIPLEIDLPQQVELAEESKNIAAVIEIGDVAVQNFIFTDSDIKLENVEEGYTAHINETEVKVSVYGDDDVINDLEKNNIILYVDMSDADFSEGIHTGEIKYSISNDISDLEIKPEKVQVIISEVG